MITFNLVTCDHSKLNSATKYGSILTYHAIGERGCLAPNVQVSFERDTNFEAYEKLDGMNARIIITPDFRYVIGSREELLHADGDTIISEKDGAVRALKPHAERIRGVCKDLHDGIRDTASSTGIKLRDYEPDMVTVIFGEVFGGNIRGFKQYTGKKALGFRVFDACKIHNISELLKRSREDIASNWREREKGQQFFSTTELKNLCQVMQLEMVPRVKTDPLPTGLKDTYEWLKRAITKTHVRLDDGAKANSEGLVIRTSDRRLIAKIRHKDYEKTEKKGFKK